MGDHSIPTSRTEGGVDREIAVLVMNALISNLINTNKPKGRLCGWVEVLLIRTSAVDSRLTAAWLTLAALRHFGSNGENCRAGSRIHVDGGVPPTHEVGLAVDDFPSMRESMATVCTTCVSLAFLLQKQAGTALRKKTIAR
jgi:hypothetical protein